jgi:exosortase/archaeosortase family protein
VTLPTATIFIAEDCSGAHFLCVALAVGVLAGVLRGDGLRTRILILIIAGLLSMAFNWLRIFLIVLAYLHPGLRQAFETMGHLTFGWWVFALDLIVFALVLRFVPRSANEQAERLPPDQTTPIRWNNSSGLWMSTIALVLLPAIAWALPRLDTYPSELPNADLRISIAETDLTSPNLRWTPHYPGTAWEDRFAIMTGGGNPVEVYGNQYHEQTQGTELISRGSHLFDPLLFSPISSSIVYLQDSRGQSISARRDILTDSMGNSWLTMYTYFVDSEPIASSRRVQLMTALRSIYARTTASVLAVATPCTEECESRISNVEDTFIRAVEDYRAEFSE